MNVMNENQVTFLVVDDNDLDVEKIERGFARFNIANPVIRAKDGLDALDYLRGEGGRERVKRPYVVLLDLNMPRMNGIEFLEELRNDPELADTSVFVLTTSDHKHDIRDAHQHNVAGYVVKPFNKVEMLEVLSTLNLHWSLGEYSQDGRQ